jgi:CubicO group peptidase (beta-lactamase class C family)
MMTYLRIPVVAFALLSTLPPAAAAQEDVATRVDRVFRQWDTRETPGCALGVARAGATVLSRSWGMADLEHDIPNSPATIFEAGSVSKQFTAAAIVLLAQQGRLSLDDDVRRHVPELPDYGATITLRHLLTHTSGLRDWGNVAAIGGWSRTARTHTHDHVLDILSRQRALNFVPGTEYSYSNSGYNLLAIIVARVSGTSFADFSRTHLFEPLGMTNTQWRDDYTRIVRGRSAAYSPGRGGYVIDRPIENVHGNGGLLTTVADLLVWNQALAAGRVGAPGFAEEMHRQGVLNDGSTIDYALGIVTGTYRGVREVYHTGATSGYRAFLARFPDQLLDIALLCNAGNANPGTVGYLVADIFLGDALQPVAARPPSAPPAQREIPRLSAEDLVQYAGEYYSPDAETTLRVAVEEGRLVAMRRPSSRMALTPWSRDVFDAAIGRITFMRDEAGRITQLSVEQPRVYDLRFDRRP